MIVTLAEGEINELHVGLKGTMNALFLKDLAAKTHRGLRGRVEKGCSGGGLCYGYDVVTNFDAAGEPVRGERRISEVEGGGHPPGVQGVSHPAVSPRAIARCLNTDGIPCPSGKLWTDSTIRGQVKRGTGLINNELYIGRPGLEPAALRQEPGDRQAGVAGQSRERNGLSRRFPSFASSMTRSGRR